MRIVEAMAQSLRQEMDQGRGGNVVSPFPVSLEPPFTPFSHAGIHKRTGSRAETSMLLRATPILASDLRFLKARLSPVDTFNPSLSEQLLLALGVRNPIAFEVVGLGGTVSIQFAAAKQDTPNLVGQLRSHYPHSQVFEGSDLIQQEGVPNLQARSYRLRDSHLFQIRVEQRLESYLALMGVLAGLDKGEAGLFQVLFQSTRHPWQENILKVASDPWDSSKSTFIDLPDLPRKARHKVERPLLAVAVRLAASTQDLLESLEGSFLSQFESGENGFASIARQYPVEAVLGRFTQTPGMLLSVREIAALVHLPDPSALPKGTIGLATTTAKAPPAAASPLVLLGINRHQGVETPVGIDEQWMARHIFIEGFTGSGKTTALKVILLALMKKGYGLAFFDYAGDAAEELLSLVPEHRVNDVIYFNPGDRDFPPALNVLKSSEREQEILASELMIALKRIFHGPTELGPRMEWILRQAIRTLLSSEGEKTLRDIPRLLTDRHYREEMLRSVHDPDLGSFWATRGQFPASFTDPILNRLSNFLDRPTIRNILSQPNLIDLNQAMNQGKIMVFNLSKGILGEENSQVLGSFILSKLQLAAMARAELPPSERKLFVVALDEVQNQAGRNLDTTSIRSFLSEARKYGVALIMATQFTSQLDREVVSAIFGNVGTLICLRCGIEDAPLLQRELGVFTAEDLLNLEIGQAIVRMGRAADSFNLDIVAPPRPMRSFRDQIVQLSRDRYCRPRSEVEELFRKRVEPQASEVQPVITFSGEPANKKGRTSPKPSVEGVTKVFLQETAFNLPDEKVKAELSAGKAKGASQHRYLQSLIKRMGEEMGYRAIVEQPTPDGQGKVDVGLEREGKRIACEISVTTTDEHELSNIEKCLRAGYDTVILCSSERRTLDKVKALASKRLKESDQEKVLFFEPEALFFYLETETASRASKEERVKGYKVKVQYQPVAETEKRTKREAVAQVILQALRRLKEKGGD